MEYSDNMKAKVVYLRIILFLLIVVGMGFFSFKNLMNFYINQELDYNEWTPELGSKFETDIASTFFDKFEFINMNGAICNILGQKSMNNIVKLNNGYLFTPIGYSSDEALIQYADSTAKLNNYLKKRGTTLVYVSSPYTSSKYDTELPVGISDYGNDNIDRFLHMLKQANVDTIDLREIIHNDGYDQYQMMYRTDHHWTTETGLYAYGILEDYIVKSTGCIVDDRISDIANYTVTRYPKWHLGSRGQRTGIYYAGIDDFDLILPNFETVLKNSDGKIGRMEDLMIDTSPLSNRNYTSRYTYDSVLDKANGDFTNLQCDNDITVLMITDSFGKAVNPYLAMGFNQLYTYYNGDVSDITPELIEKYNPDVVIMMYYPECLLPDKNTFSFSGF